MRRIKPGRKPGRTKVVLTLTLSQEANKTLKRLATEGKKKRTLSATVDDLVIKYGYYFVPKKDNRKKVQFRLTKETMRLLIVKKQRNGTPISRIIEMAINEGEKERQEEK